MFTNRGGFGSEIYFSSYLYFCLIKSNIILVIYILWELFF